MRGFASLVKEENYDVVTTHYFLHREVLVSKTLGDEMKKVLDDATKMVNFIKQRPVHSRMFKKLCENLDKEHMSCHIQKSGGLAEEEFSTGCLS
jgi:hypothetical protein